MRKFTKFLIVGLALLMSQIAIQAQTTGAVAGSVTDPNGAVVPGAAVKVKGESGREFTAVTNDSGNYRVPSVPNGLYVVTVTASGFKTVTVTNVKVDVGTPITVDARMEIGNVGEVVEISSGGEVLQTQTAAIGSSITGRQITETPIASRDALDLVGLLPGTATVGRPRSASINGLPKGALSITIDGVDVQDNLLRSSDGYFTYVRPRLDAIEEVNVSTSNPGAESGGDGAVQIKFVTKRGSNRYNGSAFYQHRNEFLNGNYWYLNRDGQKDDNGKALRQKLRLHQYGVSYGGPIPFLNFGEGTGVFNSGRDKRFFFVNYEEFRLPATQARTRTIFSPQAETGIYQYIVGTETRQANVFTIAANAGRLSTPDPTIASIVSRIRTAVGTTGTITPISGNPNAFQYNFSPVGDSTRKFLALRLDFNLTKNHSLEFVTNQQEFVPSKDFLNSQDERFPGFPSYTQGSVRDSYAFALRSTLKKNLINEARYAISTGLSIFSPGISPADFAYSKGFVLGIDAAGVTTPYSRNSYSDRNTPTYDFTDNVTWLVGNHSISFGGQVKLIKSEGSSLGRIVPSVGFGLDSTDSAFSIFSTTTMPGATAAQLTGARNLYATLVGRVLSYTSTAYLSPDGTYQENGPLERLSKQNSYGLYVQDAWRMKPNFTVNYGIRWQPQTAFVALSEGNYTRLESFDQVYGLSGRGNIFKPGTLTGTAPRVVPLAKGEKAYPDDLNNLAPSVGVVWSPSSSGKGFMGKLFGGSGKSVFRGGYSVSFVREGFNLLESIYGSNPGGSQSLSRSLSLGNLTVGTNLRDASNPNLSAAPNVVGTKPSFPIALTTANSTNAFSPDLKTGAVHSFSFGYQRELDRNTVVEFRYVGNRGRDLQRQYNINEFNVTENGFAAEFKLAQANLAANIAAGRGASFAYFGVGTGTSPLPIMVSFFNPATTNNPNIGQGTTGSGYTATNFANTTLVAALSPNNPNILSFSGTSFENSAARRVNATANGRPVNFFYVNPTTGVNGSFIVDNSNLTWYDSGVIEVRRRMSAGLRVSANYVWSKAQANAYASSSVVFAGFTQRAGGLDLAKNVQAFDLRHQFKLDSTYDLPFGRGRQFLSGSGKWADAIVGGWSILPTIRWQSGSPFSMGNVQLVGLTAKELQKMVGVYKDSVIVTGAVSQNVVTYLPVEIINQTRRAFNIDVAGVGGYGTTYGGAPTGKFIAPAGYGNCVAEFTGQCGINNLILYGPSFFKLDASVTKRVKFSERRRVELTATFLDALNHPNFRVGGWAADTVGAAVGGATFGQLASGSAYQDVSTTNDPGGRIVDVRVRFVF